MSQQARPTFITADAAAAQDHARLGDSLCSQRRMAEGLQCYAQAVRLCPERADYHFKLAMAAWSLGRTDLIEPHLLDAIRLEPGNSQHQLAIAQWYIAAGNHDRALLHSDKAIQLAPNDVQVAITRAAVLERCDRSDAAWRIIEPLLSAPSFDLAMVYGRLAPMLKREREALAFIERFLQCSPLSDVQKAPLYFTAATLLDRVGRYDEAFAFARRAKDAVRQPHGPDWLSEWIDREIAYFTAEKLRQLPRATHGNRRPVFIIGMPRSGTSLVEQILASHPDVFGAGELKTLLFIVSAMPKAAWTRGTKFPESLDLASARELNELAQSYLSAIYSLDADARYVVDKYPLNYLNLGLIATLFPECHVIHCTRDPLDTCVSCYMTFFLPAGMDFTQDLSRLGAYYRNYDRHMRHWKTVLDVPMLEVNYETLVNDLEGQTRRLIEFLDLPWDDRCLKFHENKRNVATPSRDQVRRPIYASSVGRWKHYEKHIGELIAALSAG